MVNFDAWRLVLAFRMLGLPEPPGDIKASNSYFELLLVGHELAGLYKRCMLCTRYL